MEIELNSKTILVTGAAGFIGASLISRLLSTYKGISIVGIDNLNDYYDVALKQYRLDNITSQVKAMDGNSFQFIKVSIADKDRISEIFSHYKPKIVVNLAAQAGVRNSIDNPDVYIESNIIGFYNILEACRHSKDNGENGVEHLVYASSSSVYGANKKIPYQTDDMVDNPVSLYAATKKSNELLAHAYSKLYQIPSTGLRFFTVYGPAGRPDMAYFEFTRKMINNEIIKLFNFGNCMRDFTYIDDIVTGLVHVMKKTPQDTLNGAPYHIYNIGNHTPENLMNFVNILEEELKSVGVLPISTECKKELVPMQLGDVEATYADVSELIRDFGFKPSVNLREGLRKFAIWYKEYYMKEDNI